MCMITVYKGSIKDENKIAENVDKYSLDLKSGKLTLYSIMDDPREFEITKSVSWDERNDTMIFE
ncbi:MAG: hypothetical protein ACOX6Z_03980 [Dethiobacteria bacterium]|jgi:hypothetical protein